MKKTLIVLVALLLALPLTAQKNPDVRYLGKAPQRAELVLPQVNGYNVYKADFHIHTVYSDGDLSGKGRATEAYYDGLDIIAITDHLEYRPNEGKFLQATAGYHKRLPEPRNYKVHYTGADKEGILADLNVPYLDAKKPGERLGLLVIPGGEITRHPDSIGHYNALFIKDANKIHDNDPEKAIRNARAQGALITHNHPGWRRATVDKNEFHKKVYGAGLIDGVEVVNGMSFGAKLIKRCLDENLFMVAATDIHASSAQSFVPNGFFRTCTFVLAKELTSEAVREALEARRTLAYAGNNVMGEESLVKALFYASVTMKVIYTSSTGEKTVALTNMSSIPYTLRRGKNSNDQVLKPFQTLTFKVAKDKDLGFYVRNMWTADEKHPNGKHPHIKYVLAE